MPSHDILVIGASAGGVEALSELVKGFPRDIPASIFVVIHLPAHSTSVLPKILARNGILPSLNPSDGDRIQPGHIYVAPPDQHMLIKRGRIRVVHGPRENGSRPSIDPLFRTAARAYGKRVIGIVLSGVLDDGTAGLIAIKKQGGIAIVQDPSEAAYPAMPESAIAHNNVDHILRVSDMASVVERLVHTPVEEEGEEPVSEEMEIESDIAELDMAALHGGEKPGTPSRFSCPDCNGVLWEIDDGDIVRFRCRVGHAYSPETLLAVQSDSVEAAIWAGLRALEENAALMQRMSMQMRNTGNQRSALRFQDQALSALRRAEVLRQLILDREPITEAEVTVNE